MGFGKEKLGEHVEKRQAEAVRCLRSRNGSTALKR
jgi:hypothetical protein